MVSAGLLVGSASAAAQSGTDIYAGDWPDYHGNKESQRYSPLDQINADNVNSRGEFFTFIWEGSEEKAKLVSKNKGQSIRFQWIDDEDTDYYFEMRIQVDAITKDVSIMVTDFAEDDEIEEGKMLWENMISELKQLLGSV